MNKSIVKAVLVAGAMVISGSAIAGTADTSASQAKPLLNGISHGSLHYLYSFAGPSKNIVGVVAKVTGGKKMMGWMVDGKYLMPGPMFNASGANLTMMAAQAHGLVPKPINSQHLAKAAMGATGFTLGTKGPLMIAFLDPNCIFCHEFWEKVNPEVKAGKVHVKVVPVGFLKPSSFPKAVTIMQGKNAEKGWAENEAKFNTAKEEGGTVPAKKLSAKYSQVIHSNTALLAKSGEVATPTVIVCSKGEKVPSVMHGLPENGLSGIIKGAVSVQASGTCAG